MILQFACRNSSAIFRKQYFYQFIRPPSLPARHYQAIAGKTAKYVVPHNEIKFGLLFRRFLSENSGKLRATTKANNISRLLTLAKPEKWKLMGMSEPRFLKNDLKYLFLGAVCFLLVSSTVTMAVPFALGKVIDTIYTKDPEKMKDNLNRLTRWLLAIFVVGGLCNLGRVYYMSIAGRN